MPLNPHEALFHTGLVSTFDPSPSKPTSRWSASKHADDLGPLNICATVIAAMLIIPGVFAGGGGLPSVFLGFLNVLPPIVVGIAADRRGGPRSARIAFIAAGVFIVMVALQLRG